MDVKSGWHRSPALSVMKLSSLAVAFALLCGCTTVSQSTESPLHEQIRAAAYSHGISPSIALGLVRVESQFDIKASNEGNYGLMQVRLATAKGMGFKGNLASLMQPETNLEYGMRYLSYCIDKFNKLDVALGCYNGNSKPNTRYARKVIKTSREFTD